MKIVYTPEHRMHVPMKELDRGRWIENPEKPERIEAIKDMLILSGFEDISPPLSFPDSYVYMIHSPEYVEWLRRKSEEMAENEEYFPKVFGHDMCFDTGTPISSWTFKAARTAVDVVLTASKYIMRGENVVYALCRPPGHHASFESCGGYCYFNNVAISAFYFLKHGSSRIGILDLDFHHGNGTQDIFYFSKEVYYISIHGDPKEFYPWISGFPWEVGEGEGEGYNLNLPLNERASWKEYSKALEKAINEIKDFEPEILLISMGFDTHKEDPLGKFELEDEDFYRMGYMIAQLDVPKLVVQEGGYNPKACGRAAIKFFTGLSR